MSTPLAPSSPRRSRLLGRRFLPALSAALLCALLAAPPAVAQAAGTSPGVEEGVLMTAEISGVVGRNLQTSRDPVSGQRRYEGVTIELYESGMLVDSTTTDVDGRYQFDSLIAGTYEVRVDFTDLPPGLYPSSDPDGVATPNSATITLAPGEDENSFSFFYRGLVDLVLVKELVVDNRANDGTVDFLLTVTNLGPAAASDVRVFDPLPADLELVAIEGCPNPPVRDRMCALGDLAVDESASYTIRARPSNPTNPITNRATVSSDDDDTNEADNVAVVVAADAASAAIPALSDVMLGLLVLLIAGIGVFALGRGGSA